MTSDAKKPESNVEPAERVRAARRPYSKPRLRRLGSVRDLTLGATGPLADATPGLRRRP